MHRSTVVMVLALALIGPVVKAADLDLLTAATTTFSQNLYQQVALTEDNVVYSPYSIHSCLTMTSVGARADTATEMSQTLQLTSLTGTAPHQAYRNLISQMNSVKQVTLNTANAIFVNPTMPIDPTFSNTVQTDYFASSSNFDLAAPVGPEKVINDFVSNKTEGIIQDLIPPATINSDTVMILVNTIFFNGTWQEQFADYKTYKQDFTQLGGTKAQVDMMHDDRLVKIKRGVHGADVAELPFKDPRFSLFIVLPQKVDGITNLESQIAISGNVDDFFQGLQYTSVQLAIPKFKIESSLKLKTPLQNMGMNKPFDPLAADFSGLTTAGNAYISSVLHKAMIEVKETGTVAAAATAVVIQIESVMLPPNDQFVADHPFMFFLRDNTARNILFQGKFSG